MPALFLHAGNQRDLGGVNNDLALASAYPTVHLAGRLVGSGHRGRRPGPAHAGAGMGRALPGYIGHDPDHGFPDLFAAQTQIFQGGEPQDHADPA